MCGNHAGLMYHLLHLWLWANLFPLLLTTRWQCYSVFTQDPRFNCCWCAALNATYYTLHYTLAPPVSPLHSPPFTTAFLSRSEPPGDVWAQERFHLNLWSWVQKNKSVCFRHVFLWKPSSHNHLSVCWCRSWPNHQVSVGRHSGHDTMHKALYCEERV